jgi:hypothetical protein
LIRRLESEPPERGIRDSNVDAFATFVEELDHLLVLAERASQSRPLTLFELELHANVSKHLVLSRFLARSLRKLGAGERAWLRRHLFGGELREDDPELRTRYRDAAAWALRLLEALEGISSERRVETLRRFHALPAAEKIELIGRLSGGSDRG